MLLRIDYISTCIIHFKCTLLLEDIISWHVGGRFFMAHSVGILKMGHSTAVASQWPRFVLHKWKTRQLTSALGGATYVINLFNTELIDVFRTKYCWSVRKVTEIGPDVLEIRVVKRSGLTFLAHPVYADMKKSFIVNQYGVKAMKIAKSQRNLY